MLNPLQKPQGYVAGFLFSPDFRDVVLVLKNRPAFQAGLYNAVGGKVEEGEIRHAAMVREFREETGMNVPEWKHEAVLTGTGHGNGPGFRVDFYSAVSPILSEVRSETDESIHVISVNDVLLRRRPVMSNLPLLIQLCLDRSGILRPVHFVDGIPQ
jgi:8-oxo-dGTP pyrophosphatase MutT (NUDIX family)